MIRFMLFAVSFVLFASSVRAQTPQQLEMLKNKEKTQEVKEKNEKGTVYRDEKTGKFVIPVNTNEPTIELDDGEMIPLPMEKTDDEVMESFEGPNRELMSQMTKAEQEQYMNYLVQDRIILTTDDYVVIESGSGTKICQAKLKVLNNTPRTLEKIQLTYTWGRVNMPAQFADVPPVTTMTLDIALAGSVCDVITKGAK